MSEYNNDGKVSLWKRAEDAPQNAPALKGTVYAHRDIRKGEKLDLALWRNDSANERAPMLTGKISDPFVKQHETKPDQRGIEDRARDAMGFDNDLSDLPF